jgi:hypothetical protein
VRGAEPALALCLSCEDDAGAGGGGKQQHDQRAGRGDARPRAQYSQRALRGGMGRRGQGQRSASGAGTQGTPAIWQAGARLDGGKALAEGALW